MRVDRKLTDRTFELQVLYIYYTVTNRKVKTGLLITLACIYIPLLQ